ncbi:MAG: hypothetical protein JXR84_19700 [Anaerolineae bacterium]|nr:hypothetical protein [Anaerolineae bacterium]
MSPVVENVLKYLWNVAITTVMQLFIVLGVGAILGYLIHHLSRATESHASDIFPRCAFQYMFMIPGSVVHELSHWVLALLFGFKVQKLVLFQCKPGDPYGGYVVADKPHNIIQQIGAFFMGIGPIILGALAIYEFSHLLVGPGLFASASFTVEMGDSPNLLIILGQVIESVVVTTLRVFGGLLALQGVPAWKVWLFIYLAFSLSSAMNLSPPDLRLAAYGFRYVLVLLLLANIVFMLDGVDALSPYIVKFSQQISGLYTIMLFALSLNLIAAAITVPLGIMFGRSALR